MRILSTCILLLFVSACPAPAVYQSAKPLAPGDWQVGGGIGVVALQDVPQDSSLRGGNVEAFVRRGIKSEIDIGLRLYTVGAEASVKWRFFAGKWDLALMPAVAVARTQETQVTTNAIHSFTSLPLLATTSLSDRWSITIGPRLQTGLYKSDASSTSFGFSAGGLVMLAVKLGPIRLMPELDLSRTIAGDVPIDGWMSHLGVGIAWDF